MAKTTDIVVSALAEWNGKALAKGQKDVSSFDKSVKKLGKTFAAVFGTAALLNYSKNAIKAFAADEKAAKSLEVQLKNLGYGFSAPGVELYIANLQRMYGVLDDQLRPAFQTLITASGSLTASQKALDVALNVSAATGKSVEEVSAALAKGFSGQTTALSRLGAGLDKATLASGDMNKILDELNAKFAGQAAARLDTYTGKMDALKVASANASEIIGQSLIESLEALSGSTDIQTITSQMEAFATEVGFAITEISKLIGLLNKPIVAGKGILGILGEIVFPGGNPFRKAAEIRDRDKKYPGGSGFTYDNSGLVAAAQARAAELKVLKEKNKVNKELLAQDKAKLALNDLAKKFDLERIGIMTALNNATDEETKLRLKAQLALLDNNAALAAKYSAELEAAAKAKLLGDAMGALTNSATAAALVLKTLSSASNLPASVISSSVGGILGGTTSGSGSVTGSQLANAMAEAYLASPSALEGLGGVAGALSSARYTGMALDYARSGGSSQPEVTVNLNAAGSIIGLQEVDAAIQDALLRIYRQNGDLMPAGFLP